MSRKILKLEMHTFEPHALHEESRENHVLVKKLRWVIDNEW